LTTKPRPIPNLRRDVPLDANALELFARIVAAGSFAQAARQLGQTRAAVSRRVALIESALGQPLFARTTRALGLTETGRRLAAKARAVADATAAARLSLRSLGDAGPGLSGTLRVTSVPIFGQAVLAPLLARFQAEHPALRFELRLTHRRVDLLREDVDVAFRLTNRPPEDWVALPLMPFVVRAYAAPGAGPALATPAELAGRRCLVFGNPAEALTLHWRSDAVDAGDGADVAVALEPAMVADDMGTLLAVARAGGSIVFAPDFCARADLARGELVDVLPGWRLRVAEGDLVQALTLPQPAVPESARALLRFVRDALGAPGAFSS